MIEFEQLRNKFSTPPCEDCLEVHAMLPDQPVFGSSHPKFLEGINVGPEPTIEKLYNPLIPHEVVVYPSFQIRPVTAAEQARQMDTFTLSASLPKVTAENLGDWSPLAKSDTIFED
jgi:hypothetical protein